MVNELICFFFCADIANIKDMVGDKRFARMCLTCVRLETIFVLVIYLPRKADIRNPLRYLLMNAVASRSVSGSFQLPLT